MTEKEKRLAGKHIEHHQKRVRDLRPHILDERIKELEKRVRHLETALTPLPITPYERQVLQCMVNGLQYKTIAKLLNRSPKSIMYTRGRLHLKFGTRGNISKLLHYAVTMLGVKPQFTVEEYIEKKLVTCNECKGIGRLPSGFSTFGIECEKCKGTGSLQLQ